MASGSARARSNLLTAARRFDDFADGIALASSVDARIFNELAPHLHSSRIPVYGSPTELDLPHIKVAVASIRVLGDCGDHYKHNHQLTVHALPLIPDVWKWSQFILANEIENGPYRTMLPARGRDSVSSVLNEMSLSVTLRRAWLETSLLETCTRYWLNEGGSVKGPDLEMFTHILDTYLDVGKLLTDFAPVVRAARGDRKWIARTALRRLKPLLDHQPYHVGNINIYLSLVLHMVSGTDRAMLEAVLCAEGIPVAIRCLRLLVSQPFSIPLRDIYIDAYRLIRDGCAKTTDNSPWLLQAINNGLLQAILGSSVHVKSLTDKLGELLTELFDVALAPHLVHRPVLRAAGKQLRRRPFSGPIRSPLRERWVAFHDLFDKRQKAKEAFDRSFVRTCFNCKCDVSNVPGQLKQCGGCQGPRYCSLACQTEDWPLHGKTCHALQRERSRDSRIESLQVSDSAFVATLAEREVLASWSRLREDIKFRYPVTPSHELSVQVDWRLNPAKVSVGRLQDTRSATITADWHPLEESQKRISYAVVVKWGADEITLKRVMRLP